MTNGREPGYFYVAVAIFLGLVISAFVWSMLGPFQTCLRNNPAKDRVYQCIAIMGSAQEK